MRAELDTNTFSERTKITATILGPIILGVLYVATLRADNQAVAVQSARSELRINEMENRFSGVKDDLEVVRRSVVRQETMLEFLVKEQKK